MRRLKRSREEILERKVRRRIKKQSGFLKHGSIYLVLLFFYLVLSLIVSDKDFFIGFGIVFFLWGIGLSIHFLSAFVFNRIDQWNETKYHKELIRLQLTEPDMPEEGIEEFELKPPPTTVKRKDDAWNDGDFV